MYFHLAVALLNYSQGLVQLSLSNSCAPMGFFNRVYAVLSPLWPTALTSLQVMDLYCFLWELLSMFDRFHCWEVLCRVNLLLLAVLSLNNSPFLWGWMDWNGKAPDTPGASCAQGLKCSTGRWGGRCQGLMRSPSKQGGVCGFPAPGTHRACRLRSVARRFPSSSFGRLHPSVWLCSPQVVWWWEDNFSFLHKVHRANTSDWCRAARQNPTNAILRCQNPSLTTPEHQESTGVNNGVQCPGARGTLS